MKTLYVMTMALTMAMSGWIGCGGGGNGGTGGAMGLGGSAAGMDGSGQGGSGGGPSYDASPDLASSDGGIDKPVPIPDASPLDVQPIDVVPSKGIVDCTGLTPEQCHNLFINPVSVPETVLQQDPGVAPPPGYPACSAI